MDAKTLNKRIDALGRKTATWRDDVQIVLVQCAARAFDPLHADVDGFTRLVHKMQGADMTALIAWIKTYAPAKWSSKQETPYGLGGFTLNKSFVAEYDALYLAGEAWWVNAKKPADVPDFLDLDASIAALIKRVSSSVKNGKPVCGSGPLAEIIAKAAQVPLIEVVTQ